jgi:hypothetical protein
MANSPSGDEATRPRHTRRSDSPLEPGLPEPTRGRSWAARFFGAAADNDAGSTDSASSQNQPDSDADSGLNDSIRIGRLERQLAQQSDILTAILEKLSQNSTSGPSTAATPTPESAVPPPLDALSRQSTSTAPLPRWKLEKFGGSPVKNLTGWRKHLDDFLTYQDRYQLPESDCLAELLWSLDLPARDFVKEVQEAFPEEAFAGFIERLRVAAGEDNELDAAYASWVSFTQHDGEDGKSFLSAWDDRLRRVNHLQTVLPGQAYVQLKAVLNNKYRSLLRNDVAPTGSIGRMPEHQRCLELRKRIRAVAAERSKKDKPRKTTALPANPVSSSSTKSKPKDNTCRVHEAKCAAPSWGRCPDALSRAGVVCQRCKAKAAHLTRDHDSATQAGAGWLIAGAASPAQGSSPQ